MIDQMMETFRKATETTLQMHQQMYRQWTEQWFHAPWLKGMPGMTGMPGTVVAGPAGAWLEQIQAFQKQMANSVTEMLRKHRDTLDTQYAAGMRTIEEAFRVGEAKDPEQLRRLTEGLWKQSFDCLRTVSEGQMKEFQRAVEVWFEGMAKGAAALKP